MKRGIKLGNIEIVEGLTRGDEKVINFLYDTYFENINRYVKYNSGSSNDAEDVFQDALLLVYQKIVHENVKIHDGFKAYFFVVCKNIWAKKLSRRKNYKRIINEISAKEINFESFEKSMDTMERKKLYLDHIDMLGDRCKELIRLSEGGKSLKEIAEILNIESVSYTKKVKYKCKEKLMKSIKSDPRFNELSKDN
ncbi:MAG: sigma-70 family RNA polymerase sigma factor [Bacteroidales bacterium]|nr:sigma-70 family RNA polymerase sigma factor [Bacteroidales bacterium]MCF8402817.1 sigma-70 family RNA polymerase sigma factor [Bacteroidales bacterium]